MASEHALLDVLLGQAEAGKVDSYREFRQRLLRHIRIEERLLLPMAQRKRGGSPLPLAARLRLDHGAFAAMMMLPPVGRAFHAINSLLRAHNPLEEEPDGVYQQCDTLADSEAAALLLQMEQTPSVPVSPWQDNPKVFAIARRALERAGRDDSWLEDRG